MLCETNGEGGVVRVKDEVHVGRVAVGSSVGVTIMSDAAAQVVLSNVYMVLLPVKLYGMTGILYGHEKMVMILDMGQVKCVGCDGSVLMECSVADGIAYTDGVNCTIVVHSDDTSEVKPPVSK